MGVAPSPAADHLFKIRDPTEARLLPESQAVAYHHTVAQLLFLSRVRRDTQTTVAFLTTWVKAPDEDDWGKLKRFLKYLKGTCSLKLTLAADSLTILHWYVDASHQIQDNCHGHTGAFFTLSAGAITSSSNKQKINTKSSTKSELVAVHDKSGDILWTHHFLEAQGYTISDNIIFQDNMSTLSLGKNGHTSSSKRTKHIKAKYFFIQHYYQTGEIYLCYCPTKHMWVDILTKPLQGLKFCQMRAILMNCPIDYAEDQPLNKQFIVKSAHDILMKPRILPIKPSLRECVEVSSSRPKTMARVKSGGNPQILKILSSGKKKVTWRTPSVSSPTRKQNSVSLSTPLICPLHLFTPQRSPSSHCGCKVEAPRS